MLFLMMMAEEWGTPRPSSLSRVGEALYAEQRALRKIETPRRYVEAVRDVLRRARRKAEHEGRWELASRIDETAGRDGRLIAAYGHNHVRPKSWVDNFEVHASAMDFWYDVNPRPELLTSTYNLDPDLFYRAYRRGWLKDVNMNGDAEIYPFMGLLESYFRSRDSRSFRWVLRHTLLVRRVLDALGMSELNRLMKAGPAVWFAAYSILRSDENRFERNWRSAVQGDRGACTCLDNPEHIYWVPSKDWVPSKEQENIWRGAKREMFWERVQRALQRPDFWDVVAPKKAAWRHYIGRAPRGLVGNVLLDKVSRKDIRKFDWRVFSAAKKYLDWRGLEEVTASYCAVNLMSTFGQRWKTWVTYLYQRGIDAHDASYWLRPDRVQGLGTWLLNHKDSNLVLCHLVSNGWKDLTPDQRRLPIQEMAALIKMSDFDTPILDKELAAECSLFGVGDEDFRSIQDTFLHGKESLREERVPGFPSLEFGDYRVSRMRRWDPRGLFLGEHTDCCQSVGGVGGSCAWHGVLDRDGAFVIIEKAGRIVAQSWVWRHGDHLIFDSLEYLGSSSDKKRYRPMMASAAEAMVGRLGVRGVYGGAGFGKDRKVSPFHVSTNYTDASRVKRIAGTKYKG
jgi:hypothetical protein